MINVKGVELKTYRLIIRKINESDLDDFNEYASVPGVGEAAGWNHHNSKEESELILKKMADSLNEFAIVYKANNKMIGTIGLQKPQAEIENKYGVEAQNNAIKKVKSIKPKSFYESVKVEDNIEHVNSKEPSNGKDYSNENDYKDTEMSNER